MKPISVMRMELAAVVDALVRIEGPDEVADVLRKHGCSYRDFKDLDEGPGHWGYRDDEGGWHWKLRRFRNDSKAFPKWCKEVAA